MFVDCFKHNRSLCHECKEDGLCDGQPAHDFDVMKLVFFETTLTVQLTKLDNQFDTITDILQAKTINKFKCSGKRDLISKPEAKIVLEPTCVIVENFNKTDGNRQPVEILESQILRVVQTQIIIVLKSMSKRGESDIQLKLNDGFLNRFKID